MFILQMKQLKRNKTSMLQEHHEKVREVLRRKKIVVKVKRRNFVTFDYFFIFFKWPLNV